jgi:hypothetical protein
MNKNKVLTTTVILLVVLGVAMIYLGGFYAPKVMLPPILSGIGFILIAWALYALRDK